MPLLYVSSKVMGQKAPSFPDFEVPLPENAKPSLAMTLRDLLAHLVTVEVEAFNTRQEARQLTRILSAADITRGAVEGKIDPADRQAGAKADVASAVNVALQAFEDGLYFVFLDGQQRESLDEIVDFGEASRILFVRLTPLAGG
jgi:hypothetical protein